jgi:DNA primase
LALIPPTTVAEIRDRTDIVAIVSEYVQLRRSGTNHQGLCPFHQEKSPSFTVSAAKQFFYCFGCQKSGDVFRFVMDLTGRSFVDVAQELAARAGVIIPEPEPEKRPMGRGGSSSRPAPAVSSDERTRLLRLNELAARFFETELKRHGRAQEYLKERGVSAEMAARFRLGYAPEAWDGFLQLCVEKRVPHELAEQAGLLIRREGGAPLPPRAPATPASHYDRFRNRIMFPLLLSGGMAVSRMQTTQGDVVAFGGRVLPGDGDSAGAKYINSPETPLYKKGDHLFGMHSARDAIRKQRQVILVEGNFDVIALQQQGFDNTVAPMGTALTETQVRLLSRLISEDGHVVLMLDGDRAGRSATLKDIFLFSESNLRDVALLSGRDVDVRVARLPDGEDPDTFAHRDPAALMQVVRTAQPAVDYAMDEALARAEHGSVSGQARVLERVAPLLAGLRSRTVQEMYVGRLAKHLGTSPELLWRHLSNYSSQAQAARPSAPAAAPAQRPGGRAEPPPRASAPIDVHGLNLIALIINHPHLLALLHEEVLDSLENPVLSELLRQAREAAGGGATLSIEKLIELAPEETRPEVAEAALSGKFLHSEHPEQELSRISKHIRARAIQRESFDLKQQLIRTQKSGDTAAWQSIYQRMQELNRLRAEILAMNGEMENGCAPLNPNAGTVTGDTPR